MTEPVLSQIDPRRIKLIQIAASQIGTKEEPPMSNQVKYNTWFYNKEVSGAAYAWCGTFVSWVFNESGIPLPTIDFKKGYAGCPYAVRNLKKWGKLVTTPMPGDVVFFDWDGNGVFDHTGIFHSHIGTGLFCAIEGNTSFTNNSNGGEVMKRTDRKYKHAIFVRPFVLEK